MEAKRIKISQSMMKDLVAYLQDEECGLLIYEKYFKGLITPPSKAMLLGQFFEYMLTGALPKGNNVPEPEMVYKGTPKEKLSADFERCVMSVEYAKRLLDGYGIKTVKAGLTISTDKLVGTVDIYAEWTDQHKYNSQVSPEVKTCFIDLKFTGRFDDKWEEFGWHVDSLDQKHKLMIQGVHYKLLAKEAGIHENIPFYYFVFDAKDPNNAKIIHQNVDDVTSMRHVEMVDKAIEFYEKARKNGLKAKPTPKRCNECPINTNCQSKMVFPVVQQVLY
jgi:hypothetical protein